MSNCSPKVNQRLKGSIRLLPLFLLTFSLFPLPSHAGPYSDLDARLAGKSDSEAVTGLKRIAGGDGDAIAALAKGPKAARAYVGLRATLEGASDARVPSIESGPSDERIESNWLSKALSRLRMPEYQMPESKASPATIGSWATTLMWSLLAAIAAYAVFMLTRYVRLPKGRKKAIVDPEEPVRSSDAWIEEANALIAQGRYREAVRGLYVAGLMRFDEAGVARFDRHQTNWEHLRRIEASPKRPEGADVRAATGRFDRLWYGRLPSSLEDATTMRAWYDALVLKLAEGRS